jgi:hypothetical protein
VAARGILGAPSNKERKTTPVRRRAFVVNRARAFFMG